jgi:DNA-binding NtrC family response regulator
MTSPFNILVVDDQHSIRLMLESGLSLNGFRVTCARNGAEAVLAATSKKFDAVISDIYMPGGDGLEVVQKLRTVMPSLPIILMTAQGSVELAVRAVEEGATDFIAKPFEVSAVQFRPDLFYRLSVITLELPPLRERGGDVDLLVAHFLRAATAEGKPPFRLTREVAEAVRSYPFPGNVRELENAIRRAVALCPSEVITMDCLPPEIVSATGARKEDATHDERTIIADRPTVDELQRRYLQLVLDENQGKKRRAAVVLGLDRRTVQRLVAKYRLRFVSEGEPEENTDTETSENTNRGDS